MVRKRGDYLRKDTSTASSSAAIKVEAKLAKASSAKSKRQHGNKPGLYGVNFDSDAQRKKFNTLRKRQIVNTQYVDVNFLTSLGFWNEIELLLKNAGLVGLVTGGWATHIDVTLEFLSSLDVEKDRVDYFAKGSVRFQLFNENHCLSLKEIGALFGMPSRGQMGPSSDEEFKADEFWEKITGIPKFQASRSKASSIKNPIFRITHKILVNTLFGKKEGQNFVTRTELYILWGMAHKKKINIAACLVGHFLKVAGAIRGDITIGGLLTPIALKVKSDFEGQMLAAGRVLIGQYIIEAMEIIQSKENHYELRLPDGTTTPLPNPSRITLANEDNWLLGLTKEAAAAAATGAEEAEESDMQIDRDIEEGMALLREEEDAVPPEPEVVTEATESIMSSLAALRKENAELIRLVKAQALQLEKIEKRLEILDEQGRVHAEPL